tara:strand:- start:681 stop:908 length:228 start_codon:yes stop_codon:yes gene_type:complete
MNKNYKELFENMEYLFLNQKKINDKKIKIIYWYEEFAKYIKEKNINLYNEATTYAIKLERNNYMTKEELNKFNNK